MDFNDCLFSFEFHLIVICQSTNSQNNIVHCDRRDTFQKGDSLLKNDLFTVASSDERDALFLKIVGPFCLKTS